MLLEELFENLVRVVGEPVPSLEFPLRVEPLLEFEVAISVVEGAF